MKLLMQFRSEPDLRSAYKAFKMLQEHRTMDIAIDPKTLMLQVKTEEKDLTSSEALKFLYAATDVKPIKSKTLET